MRYWRIFFLVLCATIGEAQPPEVFFSKFGGAGKDVGYGICEAGRRTYAVAGITTSFGAGGTDAYVLLVDSMGQAKWERTYGGQLIDVAKSIIYNPIDSGFYVGGYSNSSGKGGYDAMLLRLSKDGFLMWQKYYGTSDWEFSNDIVLNDSGFIYLCGEAANGLHGDADGYLVKIDAANGDVIWERQYGSTGRDYFSSVKRKPDGNFVIAGNSLGGDSLNKFWLFEIDGATGDSLDSRTFGDAAKSVYLNDFTIDRNKNYVLVGEKDTAVVTKFPAAGYIYKLDSLFSFIKDQYIGGPVYDRIMSVCESRYENTYLFSRSISAGGAPWDLQVIRLSPDLWYDAAKDHGDEYDDEGMKVISLSDSGYAVVGYRSKISTGDPDLYLLKLDYDLTYAPLVLNVASEKIFVPKNYCFYYSGSLHFAEGREDYGEFTVSDALGAEIVTFTATSGESVALPPQLPSGVYFIRSKSGKYLPFKFMVP